MTLTARFQTRCAECGGRIEVGDRIEWTPGSPAAHATCPAQPEPVPEQREARLNETPLLTHPGSREGRMLAAGEVTATVVSPTGEHATFYLRALSRTEDGWERLPSADAEMIVWSAAKRGQRIGTMRPTGTGTMVMRWKVNPTDAVLDAFGAFTAHLATGVTPTGWQVRSADACGRCGRELTDPESIARGIGPDCFGQMTRAQHLTVAS